MSMQQFIFQGQATNIETHVHDGLLYYQAADVGRALNCDKDNRKKYVRELPEKYKKLGGVIFTPPTNEQSGWWITESGALFLALRVHNEVTIPFKEWLAEVVIPSHVNQTSSSNAPPQPSISVEDQRKMVVSNAEAEINIYKLCGTWDDPKKFMVSDYTVNRLAQLSLNAGPSEVAGPSQPEVAGPSHPAQPAIQTTVLRTLSMYIDDNEFSDNFACSSDKGKLKKKLGGNGGFGTKVKAKYISRNGKDPYTQSQSVHSRNAKVCAYTDSDYDEWIHDYVLHI
eukprot:Pgem_evm3s18915